MSDGNSSGQRAFWPTDLKRCTRCKQIKPQSEFYRRRKRRGKPCDQIHSECKECWRQKERKRRKKPGFAETQRRRYHESGRGRRLLRKYGLTEAEYKEMWRSQNGLCAICGRKQVLMHGKPANLSVDHDHATGKVRELLCRLCNYMLGWSDDDPKLLDRAAAYLRKHGKR